VFKPSRRYGDELNSFDALKLLALSSMIADHYGEYLRPDWPWLRVTGRLAFPLFLFLVGYSGVWTIKADLLGWTLAVAAAAVFTRHPAFPMNILAAIVCARLLMRWIARGPIDDRKAAWVFGACLLFWLPSVYLVDFGSFTVVFALCGRLLRTRPGSPATRLCLASALTIHSGIQIWLFHFAPAEALATAAVGVLAGLLLWRFTLVPLEFPERAAPLRRVLQWTARNTLPIYGLHVIILMIAERAPGFF
jgi:hypothetical protein